MSQWVAGPRGCDADHQLSLRRTKDIDVEETGYWTECEQVRHSLWKLLCWINPLSVSSCCRIFFFWKLAWFKEKRRKYLSAVLWLFKGRVSKCLLTQHRVLVTDQGKVPSQFHLVRQGVCLGWFPGAWGEALLTWAQVKGHLQERWLKVAHWTMGKGLFTDTWVSGHLLEPGWGVA